MLIQELVGQGIRGFPTAVRTPLKTGYTLFMAPQAGLTLWPWFDALFYPDPRSSSAAALINPQASVARLGCIFQGRDGQTYRLLRELGGAGALSKADAANKYVTVTQDATEIAQYLRAQLGVPTRGSYELAFTLSASQLPSVQPPPSASAPGLARPKSLGGSLARPLSSGAAPVMPTPAAQEPRLMSGSYRIQEMSSQVEPVDDLNAAREQLEQLKQELVSTKEVEELQFKLDGVQQHIFQSSNRVKQAESLRQELANAQAAVEATPSLESMGLPPNVGERAAKMESIEKTRDDQLARLEREREQFLGRDYSPQPLVKDQQFWSGLALGVFFFCGGIVLGHGWRYLSLLDIPAFGFSAIVALRWLGDVQSRESQERRRGHYDDKEKQIRDAFENEVLSVKTAMKLLNVETTTDLLDQLGKRQVLEVRVREVQDQLTALESDPTYVQSAQEYEAAQAELAPLEARIAELSSFTRQPHQIEADIEELEARIRITENPAARAAPAPAPAPSPSLARPASLGNAAAVSASAGAPTIEDPFPRLLDVTTDLFQLDVPGLGQLLASRASQYLAALTDKRFSQVEFNHMGQATLVQAGSGGKVPVTSVDKADVDLLYVAVKFTLMEKLAERQKLPYVFDDPFGKFDPSRLPLLARMLKHLGTKAQVLHITASNATQSAADALVELAPRA
jgi:TolA-binding protein